MKLFHVLSTIFRSKGFLMRSYPILKTTNMTINFIRSSLVSKRLLNKAGSKFLHIGSDNEDLYEDFPFEENELDHNKNVRNIIFKNHQDDIITELNSCVSVEQVLNLVMKYKNIYEDKHAVQTILVLTDLQRIYFQFNGFSKTALNMFLENLKKNEGFYSLLGCIRNELHKFDPNYLSYVILYLNKLGISMEDMLMQNLALKVRDNLLKNFCLDQCTKFLTVIFYENSVRPYYLSLSIAPLVFNHIEKCNSVHDLYNLAVCLNKLHNLVTTELLEKYKGKVTEFVDKKKLTGADYSTLLKIILLLNYPEWRYQNIQVISNCILLLKDEINLLNIEELAVLYEIFFKNQEPGIILNSIQRCSAKFLHQLDEEPGAIENLTRLRLFSSLIYFSSPLHRIQFRTHMPKYLNICQNYKELIQLRKIFSYVKVSDPKVCANYWNLSLRILEEKFDGKSILKQCQNYIYFNTDINNYRHYKFESRIINLIRESLLTDPFLNPTKISGYLSFVILYGKGKDMDILGVLLNKFEEYLDRFKASDCLKISHSISPLNSGNSCASQEQIQSTKILLNKCTKYLLEVDDRNYLQDSMLLKAYVLRHDSDDKILEKLFSNYKNIDFMSSKIIENISHICMTTQSLIPELINRCTEYVTKYKDNILGFNAEKLLFLCYYLAYHPINGNEFFDVAVDVIIRDQERLSGLAFLQSALSLSYFNKLPSSFVKQIFNVEFLEKLDTELDNCYSKDKYPQRVRKVLMMLNRAVCLEYPEYNVPWFHKKYLEDTKKNLLKNMDNKFQQRIKEYLVQVLGTQKYISECVITPYGHHINFAVNFNKKEEIVPSHSPEIKRRVAILLLRQRAFTRFHVQLKGTYQLQKRHLEIFGYEVAVVNFSEWVNLVHGGERLEYISKLIWPNGRKNTVNVISR
ncbi:FAST kinase domain-containing protein 1, mitochondrial [Anoplophora glabripennis]|uniref:FAST kinase domain-containing protein 1, mitochondrial n=1 Tax=Anoplophora glabripennis TaxID=217634 RepID=UPI000873A0EE|nr:FAST kinase domain-containing protein 1, mitochondrial [Anoplophora glabripennis]